MATHDPTDLAHATLNVIFSLRRTRDGESMAAHDPTDMAHATFKVIGMSCDHCARAVATEVSDLSGVCEVSVDLSSGTLQIASQDPLTRQDVAAAVDGVGFQLAP